MSSGAIIYCGGSVFDGEKLHKGAALRLEAGRIAAIGTDAPAGGADVVDLKGGILAPGYVDLQVNGGGGVMFNGDPSVDTLRRIAAAHRTLGATSILPTLITDTAAKTRAAIAAATAAVAEGVPGIAGLHLEGPHLSVSRKGAHDAALIRPMEEDDLVALVAAAQSLPALMLTVAPENVSVNQVKSLVAAGAVVSLGHSDANYETCLSYAKAGASCATHLFNAMSQLGNREPGLVGAVLASGRLSAGLIADGVHVHPESMRAAWAAKTGPGRIFLVSDAMAPAGTAQDAFELEGRRISRKQGKLTLADGTLAGADLDLTSALRVLTSQVNVPLEEALASATRIPADLMGLSGAGRLQTGSQCPLIRIAGDLNEVEVLA
ncbi:N-acetylglucosamine-6-phosphate deacetylase [Leisingera sp. SS27]|uniref:N-acetylglucosamine-6-phosphate deacetylase n=1 Tax=Leisingera sp. SS27 TaxID=2979462 RepID=UPI00232E9263|nr:N-acetylglucosamine-6-phosphate deacetylase [Leisingera sp. SS27]MDC0657783.1 N-acetylglucosamine-6-phosphate deacetylase [Leisingera sp. SS27]